MKSLIKYTIITVSFLVHLTQPIQLASESVFFEDTSKNFEIRIKMNNSIIEQKEDSRCTFIKLDRDIQYISNQRRFINIFSID